MSKKKQKPEPEVVEKIEAEAVEAEIPADSLQEDIEEEVQAEPQAEAPPVPDAPAATKSRKREIMDRIEELKKMAVIPTAEELGIPERDFHRSYDSLMIRKRQCEEEIAKLEEEARKEDAIKSKIILLEGVPDEEVLNILVEEGCLVLDAETPFRYIAKALMPRMDQSLTFSTNEFMNLIDHLRDDDKYLFIGSMPRPAFKNAVCHTERGLVALIRDVIDDDRACEGRFATTMIRKMIEEQSEGIEWVDIVPVVVVNRQGFKIQELTETVFVIPKDSDPQSVADDILTALTAV